MANQEIIPRDQIAARLFVDAYLGPAAGVAWKAAEISGHSGSNAALRVAGNRLLNSPAVQELLARRFAESPVGAGQVMRILIDHLQADIADCLDIDERTGSARIDLRAARKLRKTHVIRSLSVTPGKFGDTVKVELHDSQAAAWKIARLIGMMPDKQESGVGGQGSEVVPQSWEEWEQKLIDAGVPEDQWPIIVLARRKRKRVQNRETR